MNMFRTIAFCVLFVGCSAGSTSAVGGNEGGVKDAGTADHAVAVHDAGKTDSAVEVTPAVDAAATGSLDGGNKGGCPCPAGKACALVGSSNGWVPQGCYNVPDACAGDLTCTCLIQQNFSLPNDCWSDAGALAVGSPQ